MIIVRCKKVKNMKIKHLILGLLICQFTNSLLAQNKTKKVVYIILDGIPYDLINSLQPTNLMQIAKEGGFAKALVGGKKGAYNQTPTISAVGYNSILTGTWVNKHNVRDNDIKAPNYNYPTIFKLLKANNPAKKIGIFSSWTDNRTKLVGEDIPNTGNIHFDYSYDGLELDTVNYKHDKNKDYMHIIDNKVAEEAAKIIKEKAPDLSWVYLEYTDDMGHKYGDSPQFKQAIGYADNQVGRIWQAIKHREQYFNENWLIIITTDHGRDAATGKNHGGQSDREKAGWIVTNAQDLNAVFNNQKSEIVDIMPTIARFLDVIVPNENAREIDGIPLIGKLSIVNPSVNISNKTALINWDNLDKKGNVKVWIYTTNNVATGGKDIYQLAAKSAIKKQSVKVDLSKYPSTFYKVVLEGKHNLLNRWIMNVK